MPESCDGRGGDIVLQQSVVRVRHDSCDRAGTGAGADGGDAGEVLWQAAYCVLHVTSGKCFECVVTLTLEFPD